MKIKTAKLISPLTITLLFFFGRFALSANSFDLPTTVKIGVCGDGIAEGFEECDNSDLMGETCESLGYLEGSLSCTPSCNWDKSLCIPIPEPPPDTDDNDDDNSQNAQQDIRENIFDQIIRYVTTNKEYADLLLTFDTNSNGRLESTELFDSANIWISYWKEYLIKKGSSETELGEKPKCDLNEDLVCNITDFSILMYYFDREN